MKKVAFAALAFALLPVSAHAMNENVDNRLCKAMVAYKTPPGVNYQPGVDVDSKGKKIAPADLPNERQMKLPKQVRIPLTTSLTSLLNLNTAHVPGSKLGPGTEAQLGTFVVQGNNVTFNGQPLSMDQKDKLAAACAQQTKPGKPPQSSKH
jgi:hypothetical protein